jgi:acetoin utilization deacetylase AcuC-like enzyme
MLKVANHFLYKHPLPEGHRFPMEKYELLPLQLLHEGVVDVTNFFEPSLIAEKDILAVHNKDYWLKLKNLNLSDREIRVTGFPLSKQLIEREMVIAQGTIDAALFAIKYVCAMNIAGGTHHAFSDRGEGFCLLNDQAIAAQYLIDQNLVKKVLIIDLDVHQGNGTAEIFKDNNQVFTFSMHGEKNYPFKKELSDLDVSLKDGVNDTEYLNLLYDHLPKLMIEFQPDFVFYQSGVDILETDKLGKLSVTIQGCKKRDEYILNKCKNNNLPVVCCMGGGYSEEIKHIVDAHANTYKMANEIFF